LPFGYCLKCHAGMSFESICRCATSPAAAVPVAKFAKPARSDRCKGKSPIRAGQLFDLKGGSQRRNSGPWRGAIRVIELTARDSTAVSMLLKHVLQRPSNVLRPNSCSPALHSTADATQQRPGHRCLHLPFRFRAVTCATPTPSSTKIKLRSGAAARCVLTRTPTAACSTGEPRGCSLEGRRSWVRTLSAVHRT
jgi:hypothetical protein